MRSVVRVAAQHVGYFENRDPGVAYFLGYFYNVPPKVYIDK